MGEGAAIQQAYVLIHTHLAVLSGGIAARVTTSERPARLDGGVRPAGAFRLRVARSDEQRVLGFLALLARPDIELDVRPPPIRRQRTTISRPR